MVTYQKMPPKRSTRTNPTGCSVTFAYLGVTGLWWMSYCTRTGGWKHAQRHPQLLRWWLIEARQTAGTPASFWFDSARRNLLMESWTTECRKKQIVLKSNVVRRNSIRRHHFSIRSVVRRNLLFFLRFFLHRKKKQVFFLWRKKKSHWVQIPHIRTELLLIVQSLHNPTETRVFFLRLVRRKRFLHIMAPKKKAFSSYGCAMYRACDQHIIQLGP
jgi:hypothetical protein